MLLRGPLAVIAAIYVVTLLVLPAAAEAGNGAPAQPTIAAQLDRAAGFVRAGAWSKAEQTLRAILRAHPNQPEALNLLGIAAGKQGRAVEAETCFRQALAANPSLAAASVNLAKLYQQRNDSGRALQVLERALDHTPSDARLLFETATLLAGQGQFTDAARRLKAVSPSERDSPYWELLGQVDLAATDYPQAEADLRRALEGKPDSVALLRQLAGVALKQGETSRAWQYLSRALRLAPNSPQLIYEYAQVCLQNKLAGEAVLAMRKAVLMEPDRPEFILFLGTALLDTPDFHEALPRFQRYVELRPDDPRGHLSLGWAFFLDRKFPEAQRSLEQTLRLDPKQPDAWYHLGMIAYENNDDTKALDFLTRALELAPGHANAHAGLGLVLSRERQFQRARDEFESAARLDPDNPKTHYQLSQVYTRLGDAERAGRELRLYQEVQKKSEERVNLSQQPPSSAGHEHPRP